MSYGRHARTALPFVIRAAYGAMVVLASHGLAAWAVLAWAIAGVAAVAWALAREHGTVR